MRCSHILSIDTKSLQVDLFLIRLVDMGFSEMFSYPVYRYKKPSGRSVLIRLEDMGFNEFFSDPVSIQSLQMGLVYD